MSPKPSIYIIRPKDTPGQDLLIGPVPAIWPPPDVPVKVGDQITDRWHLKTAEGNTFNVYAGRGHPNDYKWIVKDNALYVSAVHKPDDFRFESAGHNLYT
ncbi:hypothetical protein Clacol_007693 [Clathrus columnatus]|uniref:Uncharacterized protein n=1 Tax=Clathrus columnatus TaxID=1419009 RepID=A0AAV5AFL9_9AGAM|nr:hypothetical protein Clacol_007693 [Clathrus columnatus]